MQEWIISSNLYDFCRVVVGSNLYLAVFRGTWYPGKEKKTLTMSERASLCLRLNMISVLHDIGVEISDYWYNWHNSLWDFYIIKINRNLFYIKIFIYKMKTTRPVVGVFHNRNGKLRTEHTYRDFICGNIIIGKTYSDFLSSSLWYHNWVIL